MSIVRLVKVVWYSVIVTAGDSSHARLAWSITDMRSLSVVYSLRYQVRFIINCYRFPDTILFISSLKHRFPMVSYASTEKSPHSVLGKAHDEMLPGEDDGAESSAAPRQSSRSGVVPPAVPTTFSEQCASRTTTRSPARAPTKK